MNYDVVQNILWKCVEALGPVLMAALTWAGVKAASYIQAKTKNEYLQGILLRLNDAVFAAVREVQQVVVRELKEANADGKLTEEEKLRVRMMALETAKAHIGSKGLDEAKKILGVTDLERVLLSRIEAAVAEISVTATGRMFPK